MRKFIIEASDEATEKALEKLNFPEVVCCKDCKYGDKCPEPFKGYWCDIYDVYKRSDWFCADGER